MISVKEETGLKVIWVDLLCWGSAVKIAWICLKKPVEKVCYLNTVKSFSSYVPLLEKMIKKHIVEINIAESEERIENVSLYELIQMRLADAVNYLAGRKETAARIMSFSKAHGYDPRKFSEHLKEGAYFYLLKPIELQVLSDKFSGRGNSLYVVRKTPLGSAVKDLLGQDNVYFYSTLISHRMKIETRRDCYMDPYVNKKCYSDRMVLVWGVFSSWLRISLAGIVFSFFKKKMADKDEVKKDAVNIGVEFIQGKISLDGMNDIYWLRDSGVDPASIYGIEVAEYGEDSTRALSSLGIKRRKALKGPFKFLFRIVTKGSRGMPHRYVAAEKNYCLKTLPVMPRLLAALLCWNEAGWIWHRQADYLYRTVFLESLYRQLGIKMLWTMYDIDDDKLPKAQAVEMLGGLYIGSHWSNVSIYGVEIQNCYDVLFVWGKHFIENNYNRYPFMETFVAGYTQDHYFEKKKRPAADLRKKYAGKFIISYYDNVGGNDIIYSKGMQIKLYNMFITLLRRNADLFLFIKPKRNTVFDETLSAVPALKEFMDGGRISVFLGRTPKTKVPPAEAGMASDLAVGLGVSTAASECFFAGTVAFHADFTGLARNEFVKNGLGKVVFRDAESLERAIQDRIDGKDKLSHGDYRKYYEALDPFQDGKAYLRTGFVINRLQEAFRQGLSREDAVKRVRGEYNSFLNTSKISDGSASLIPKEELVS